MKKKMKSYMNIKFYQEKYDSKIIKTGGIVVTGAVEQLKALSNNPHIKASTFGVIADKY
ncbi:hypothetical protein bsdtw1_01341 [Clostridium fungisolvens]|uniref:Sigma factor regulator C-terminal domain-containing protein n=2 Tax=Clostridium fungisolvens TaxID=1604897 RepID=A0A6V8SJD5_9CLOT|nr:hypothetical protein bsdtw1_01341 [Clostridium fungisolvens]